jgi:hypothetical protein
MCNEVVFVFDVLRPGPDTARVVARASAEERVVRLSGAASPVASSSAGASVSRQPAAARTDELLLREQAIAALRRRVAVCGELPVGYRPELTLPSAWTVRRLFGSWSNYVRAAGLTPRPYRAWSRPRVIAALREWAELNGGQAPSGRQWKQSTSTHPSHAVVRRLFGSWGNALQRAGLSPQTAQPVRWTDAEILLALRRWADAQGVPRATDWSAVEPGRPTRGLVTGRFGSWNAALLAAGLEPPLVRHQWSRERIVIAMQSWAQTNHGPPRSTDWRRASPTHPSSRHVWNRFESWDAALQAAGLIESGGAC